MRLFLNCLDNYFDKSTRCLYGILKIIGVYNQVKLNKSGIEQPSFLSQSKNGDNLYLGSFSYVGNNVILGDNVIPNCFIGDNVVIGDNALLFAGAKITQRQ
jgi:UDP-3-O-[3-hydroxymyristoyl] glucosamine N-acyltransferase